jgi:type IV pilus assembly protein PilB
MPTSTGLQQFLADRIGVNVVAHRTNGHPLIRGKLAQLDPADANPNLVLKHNDVTQTLPFSELRYVFFPARTPIDPNNPRQRIDLPLADGGRLQGETRRVVALPEAELVEGFGPENAMLDVLIPRATAPACNDSELRPNSPAELLQQLKAQQYERPTRLGKTLIEQGVLTPQQLEQALELQRTQGGRLGEIVVEQGWIKAQALSRLLGAQQGIARICLDHFQPDIKALQLLPQNIALSTQALPLLVDQGRLIVAMHDPLDESFLQKIRLVSRMEPHPLQALEPRLAALIRRHYESIEASVANLQPSADEDHAAIALIESILNDAIRLQASDVHLQPTRQDIQVRYRIDGVLEEVASHPRVLLSGLVGRIKVLAQLDIAEHRIPQDGGHRWAFEGHKVDLRISIMPTVNGESVVIRILDAKIGMRQLNEIGFRAEDEAHLRRLLEIRDGMILVTGPTGSGKSTTLYAALATLNQEALNIITVENPVEYHLSGIKQIEVNPATGYDFARALRSILRHDPDVILVGEIRDRETLQIALESALTGHLVLSTLHTNNAASTLARLLEMGAADYLIRDTLRGVLAQRLVRLNCTHCTREEPIDPALRKELGVDDSIHFMQGQGCRHCRNTGYQGRTAVYELLEVTPALREQLQRGITSTQIQQQAILDGMASLQKNALQLAIEGRTSITELQRTGLIR